MTVMETPTCFGLYWPSSGCLGNSRFDYIPFPSFTHTTGMTHFLDIVVFDCMCNPHKFFVSHELQTITHMSPSCSEVVIVAACL